MGSVLQSICFSFICNNLVKHILYFFSYRYDTSYQDLCVSLLNRWEQWDGLSELFKKSDIAEFQTLQIVQFLALLLKSNNFTLQKLKTMEEVYGFNSNKNCEILLRFTEI